MAESMLFDFSGKILGNLAPHLINQIGQVWSFERDLKDFKKSFKSVQAVLEDAERKQVESNAVKLWLKSLNEISARADDVLDDVLYETLDQTAPMGKVSCCIPFSIKHITFQWKMAREIKDINAELANINKQAVDFGLQKDTVYRHQAMGRETISKLGKFSIIGRESDMESLVKILTDSSQSSDQRLSVIPVVARGGLGKTALAKLIYNDDKIKKYFNVRVWVCVADTFDVKALLTRILKSVKKITQAPDTLEDIIHGLEEEFEEKKYLIVLDSVWNEEQHFWDDFRNYMLGVNEERGNSILLTTQSEKVASISAKPYRLEGLSYKKCWSIIKERAFSAVDSTVAQELEQELEPIGIEIAKSCRGVPLVATVIGGMLESKETKQEWLSVQESGVWNLEGGNEVRDILKFSFDNLPDRRLKQCFAYCSIFRKNEEFQKETLIQLWMALGLLQVDEAQERDIEDVGDDFLKILVQRCFFQDVIKDELGNITTCKMHDLLHDLALFLSKKEIYNSAAKGICNSEASTSFATVPKFQHFVDYSVEEGASTALKGLGENAMHLHTLYTKQVDMKILFELRGLRILILNQRRIEEVPDTIRELKHLRYLDLSWCSIRVFPKSICKLYHLQTLKLEHCGISKLPKEIKNLVNLRYLHTDVSFDLELLPGLRNLPLFKVKRNQGRRIGELGCLKDVRGKLKISGLEEVSSEEGSSKEEAKAADLVGKRKLCQLELEWDFHREGSNFGDKEVLEGLQCPRDLKGLWIRRFLGDNFPEWVMRMTLNVNGERLPLHNLVYVRFWYCERCKHVPMLGHLPFLQGLELKGMDNVVCIGASFYGNREPTIMFPKLKSLSMERMQNLETWSDVPCGAGGGGVYKVFPCLEELVLNECPKIKLLPSKAVRGCSLSLKTLQISDCDSLETLPTCQGFTSLKQLSILSCREIKSFPKDFVDSCSSLLSLRIEACPNLTSSPKWHSLSSLKTLKISMCHCLETISTLQGFTSLEELTIDCTRLTCLPGDLLDSCPSLVSLVVRRCFLKSLPKLQNLSRSLNLKVIEIMDCHSLETFPTLQGCVFLEKLIIRNCSGLRCLPGDLLDSCASLMMLNVDGCRYLTSLPKLHHLSRSLKVISIMDGNSLNTFPTLQGCKFLEKLIICGCSSLRCLPDDLLDSCASLVTLKVDGCRYLTSLPKLHHLSRSLKLIEIMDCKSLETIPTLQGFTSLEQLSISECRGLKCLPGDLLDSCASLWRLDIVDCDELRSSLPKLHNDVVCSLRTFRVTGYMDFPDQLLLPGNNFTCLESLGLGPFSDRNLHSFSRNLQVFFKQNLKHPLRYLRLRGMSHWESIPETVQHLTSLTVIWIYGFGIEALPDWFGNLPNLREIIITNCSKLKHLPSIEAMQRLKLSWLNISGSPLLSEMVAYRSGTEWAKIAATSSYRVVMRSRICVQQLVISLG